MQRWFRKLSLRAIAMVLGLFAGLLLCECALHAVDIDAEGLVSGYGTVSTLLLQPSQRDVTYECFPSNPHGEFQPVPDVRDGKWALLRYQRGGPGEIPLARLAETPWCIAMQRSSIGLRDREYSLSPAPGVIRILGAGDSFANGVGVPLERTVFKRMEALLGEGFEVINCAMPGLGTAQEVQRLASYVTGLKPSRALLVFVPNDVGITDELEQRQRRINDQSAGAAGASLCVRKGTHPELRLLQLLRSQAAIRRARRENIRWFLDCYDEKHNDGNLKMLAADFQTLASLPDCKVALVLHPILEGLEEIHYPFAAIYAKVGAMARKAGLPVLDLGPVFLNRTSSALWVHPTDHHPNGKAHGLAAEAIVHWLREELPWFLQTDAR